MTDEPGGLDMPDKHETDIGKVYKSVSSYSDEKQYWSMRNVHKPVDSYSFLCERVAGTSKIPEYSWLCYYPFCNGGFCLLFVKPDK